jgi:putative redox protein
MEYLSGALGACTSITLRMYLNRKGWPADRISVDVLHSKSETADENGWRQDIFERVIKVEGNLSDEQKSRLVEIANKCPVHKTLGHASEIETRLKLNP